MKNRFPLLFTLLTALAFLTACGSSSSTGEEEVTGVGIAKNAQIIKE
ncbi:MAG: hypothetical protein GY806_14230 [Gammaproteobacteria bacterium]|nr:hypothetical protein [Gammaproteobacteria bacterium]